MAIEVISFRKYEKNTLLGFMTARLTSVGLELRDLAVHEKEGRRWIQLPAKPYEKPDGTKGWNYIVAFYERDNYDKFQEMALNALDAYQRETRRNGGRSRN